MRRLNHPQRDRGGHLRIHHTTTGSGPDVLLLHAGVADSRMWGPQRDALARSFRVTWCDLRGYGESALGSEPYSNAEDVEELLGVLGAERVAIVGASAGGHVALQVASARPELVDRLVLVSPAYPLPATRSLERFARREGVLLAADDVAGATELNVATWVGPEADDDARDLVRTMQRHAFEVQLAAGDVAQRPGPDIDLAAITARTLVVSGGQDLDHFRAVANHVAGRVAGARHVQLGWAGHLATLERPEETTELIEEFLTEP